MSVMTACPPHSPLMRAWKAYEATDGFKDGLYWATTLTKMRKERAQELGVHPDDNVASTLDREEHAKGSMWGAFMAGFGAAGGGELNAGPVRLKECRDGPMMFFSTDAYVGRSFDLYGEFSPGERALFEQIVSPGATVVEVGANIGAHTIALSRMAGAGGRVMALEPQQQVFNLLCANLALAGAANVTPICAAAGARAGHCSILSPNYAESGNFGGISMGVRVEDRIDGEGADVLTVGGLDYLQLHFLKIDVEGMELEVLRGAETAIAVHRPILYVENDRPEKSADLIAWLLAHDYRLYWHLTPLFEPDNFFRNPGNVFGQTVSINMLGVHRDRDIRVEDLREITGTADRP